MSTINPELFRSQARRYWMVFAAVASATLLMVAASYAPLASHATVMGLVLAVAAFNASMVAGFLMHLISEKKTIYALIAFTLLFVVALVWLTWWSSGDHPALRL